MSSLHDGFDCTVMDDMLRGDESPQDYSQHPLEAKITHHSDFLNDSFVSSISNHTSQIDNDIVQYMTSDISHIMNEYKEWMQRLLQTDSALAHELMKRVKIPKHIDQNFIKSITL